MKIKFPVGSTDENNQLLLPEGFLSIDLDKKAVRIHDGVTQGGFEVLGERAYLPTPGVEWVLTTGILPSGQVSREISFANNRYILHLGVNTLFLSSVNGLTWTQHPSSGLTSYPYRIVYVDGYYYAVGGGGLISRSTDLSSWSSVTNVFGTTPVRDIHHANGLFVVVGGAGKLATSSDGVTWTLRTTGTTGTISTVTYANSTWLSTTPTGILVSTDGIAWTRRDLTVPAGSLVTTAYGNGVWVIGGTYERLMWSRDLISWTYLPVSTQNRTIQSVRFGLNTFVAVGSSSLIRTSTDGITWSVQDNGYGSRSAVGLAFGNNKFIAALSSGNQPAYTPK